MRCLASFLLLVAIAGCQPGRAQQSAAKPPTVQASKTQSGFCMFPSVPTSGEPDLPLVVWWGNMEAISSRIGPDMNLNLPFPIACDDKQATLLLTATSGKNPEAVEFLLQQGADPNFNPERGIGPPLHRAALNPNVSVCWSNQVQPRPGRSSSRSTMCIRRSQKPRDNRC